MIFLLWHYSKAAEAEATMTVEIMAVGGMEVGSQSTQKRMLRRNDCILTSNLSGAVLARSARSFGKDHHCLHCLIVRETYFVLVEIWQIGVDVISIVLLETG